MDLITGLPIHPLINHAVAVLVPLSAIGTLVMVFAPKFRKNYSTLFLIFIVAGAASGLIAENSGEALAKRVGYPGNHAENGETLSKIILLFAAIYLIWYLMERKVSIFSSANQLLRNGVNALLVSMAVGSTVLTFIVGHSGAAATWEKRIAASSGESITDSQTEPKAQVKPDSSAGAITLSAGEIQKHSTKNDCWSLIQGKVYNLTNYVQNHPGGQAVITNICGKDGTAAFSNQHGSSAKPNNVLAGLLIGNLGAVLTKEEVAAVKTAAPNSSGKYQGEAHEEDEENQDRDSDEK